MKHNPMSLRRDGLCEAEKEAASLKKEPRQTEATTTGKDEETKSGDKKTPIVE